jgi:hypothetical protein
MKTILLTILLTSPFYAFLQNDIVIINAEELAYLFRDPEFKGGSSSNFSRKLDEKNQLKSQKYSELLLNPENAYSNSLISKIEYHLNRQKYQIDAAEGVHDSIFNFNTTFGIQEFQFDVFNNHLGYEYRRGGVNNGITGVIQEARIETMNCSTDFPIPSKDPLKMENGEDSTIYDSESDTYYTVYYPPSCEFNYFLKDISGLIIFNFDENGVAPHNEKRIGFYKTITIEQSNGRRTSSNIVVFSSSLNEIEKVLGTSEFTELILKTEKVFRKKIKKSDNYSFEADAYGSMILNLTQVNEISSIFYASEFFDPHFGRAIFKY